MAKSLATIARQQVAAEKRVTRRQQEIDALTAAHRLVRVTYPLHSQDEQQVIHCTAKFDMPDYGIVVGEQFDLVASSYPGYFYIVTDGATGRECTCKSHEFRHTCEHSATVNEIVKARLHAQQHVSEPHTVELTERIDWQDDDMAAHVADDLAEREAKCAHTAIVKPYHYFRDCALNNVTPKFERAPSGSLVPMR